MPTQCNLSHLIGMEEGSTCTEQWNKVRDILHPAQQAVGYAAVKRKLDKDYKTETTAQNRMDTSNGVLPFILGPKGVPYLIDSHHTASALEASGFHNVSVVLKKVCDWSHMNEREFYGKMKEHNFMNGVGRKLGSSGENVNALPGPVDVSHAIPGRVYTLRDDPWRSLAALVRKVKDKETCPKGFSDCQRGYFRGCEESGGMTPFFEFRWAYFFNEAYHRGCGSQSYWNPEDRSTCQEFEAAYKQLSQKHTCAASFATGITEQDRKAWQAAANLLVPLCRGRVAQTYMLPSNLGRPMGGESLPGKVDGKGHMILEKDPDCAAPKCPTVFLQRDHKLSCRSKNN